MYNHICSQLKFKALLFVKSQFKAKSLTLRFLNYLTCIPFSLFWNPICLFFLERNFKNAFYLLFLSTFWFLFFLFIKNYLFLIYFPEFLVSYASGKGPKLDKEPGSIWVFTAGGKWLSGGYINKGPSLTEGDVKALDESVKNNPERSISVVRSRDIPTPQGIAKESVTLTSDPKRTISIKTVYKHDTTASWHTKQPDSPGISPTTPPKKVPFQ